MHGYDPLRDWADIRLFLAIFDRGSLVGAAEHLGLTQPTVGRRLSAMENRYGTPLFARAGRRMQLTDAGKAILDSARRMELEMFAIERNLEAQSTALRGEVTISATEGTGTEWLTPVLLDFHREYPEIVLNVQIDSRAVDLLHREADIALRLGQPAQAQLIARKLVTVRTTSITHHHCVNWTTWRPIIVWACARPATASSCSRAFLSPNHCRVIIPMSATVPRHRWQP